MVRFKYLVSLGEFDGYNFRNNEFYPGLYDTLSYGLGQIILLFNKQFYTNNIDFVMHLVNVSFSSLSILGLYLLTKKLFNTNIAILASLITILNPFFFGHMGMNSKDLIIFFSLIWFCYYFYLYCTEDEKMIKNLLLTSFFIGFGCGVRLTFPVIIFPIILCGFIFLYKKYDDNYKKLIKRLLPHSLITIIITIFLVIFANSRKADMAEALMEFGAIICKPKNPKCNICPVSIEESDFFALNIGNGQFNPHASNSWSNSAIYNLLINYSNFTINVLLHSVST